MVQQTPLTPILLRVCVAVDELPVCPVPDRCVHGWDCWVCGRPLHYDPATPIPAAAADRPEVPTCRREACWGEYVRQA